MNPLNIIRIKVAKRRGAQGWLAYRVDLKGRRLTGEDALCVGNRYASKELVTSAAVSAARSLYLWAKRFEVIK